MSSDDANACSGVGVGLVVHHYAKPRSPERTERSAGAARGTRDKPRGVTNDGEENKKEHTNGEARSIKRGGFIGRVGRELFIGWDAVGPVG